MKHASSTDLRANQSAMMDQVNDDHEPLIITRAKGRSVVMISLEDYDEIDATIHLMSSPKNAARLAEAIERDNQGIAIKRELIDE
jgi:antitoxin YefM